MSDFRAGGFAPSTPFAATLAVAVYEHRNFFG